MKNSSIKSPLPVITAWLSKLRAYVGFMLFLLFAAVYVFVIMRISMLSNPAVDNAAVTGESQASPAPRIDDQAAKQLQSLKDNSVNVQTLFDQTRTNPFEE